MGWMAAEDLSFGFYHEIPYINLTVTRIKVCNTEKDRYHNKKLFFEELYAVSYHSINNNILFNINPTEQSINSSTN